MNNTTDPLMSYYLQMIEEFNISHLIIEANYTDNSTALKTILQDNFIWPTDMRLMKYFKEIEW